MEMVPLCSVVLDVGERFEVGGRSFGARLIGELVGGRWEGERFKASMIGAASCLRLLASGQGRPSADQSRK